MVQALGHDADLSGSHGCVADDDPDPPEQPKTVLAALGPKMLALSGELADGAHPYWSTPDHTAQARSILGPDKLLLVEQKVCLTTDAEAAALRQTARRRCMRRCRTDRNNWSRLGFTDAEIDDRSPRFVDAVVVWGDEEAVRAGVQAHYDAGATQVCIQPLDPATGMGALDWNVLEALAPANA